MEIHDHEINPANEAIAITADERDPQNGNASHVYCLNFAPQPDGKPQPMDVRLSFQNGPIATSGINGITNEALLAVVIDRLRGFQSGKYSCRENALALTKCEEALQWLNHRTRQRMARGVEGTHEV